MSSKIIFAGAGPGAPDLITLRCLKALQAADLVIYAGSLVNREILQHCRADCRQVDSAGLNLDQVIALIEEAVRAERRVVRLHTGDPAMYGAISEQMNRLDELGLEYEVIPGVSAVFAAAAELKCELTMPDLSQSLVLTRTPGRTPMPPGERPQKFAATGATLAFFLSAANLESLEQELLAAGLEPATPAAVVYRVGWPNQRIVRCRLEGLALAAADIKRQALVLVGKVLERSGALSKLYDQHFSHGYRNRRSEHQFDGNLALYPMSARGLDKARELAAALRDSQAVKIFFPARLGSVLDADEQVFAAGDLAWQLWKNWSEFAGHVFLAATGIAVRQVAPLLQDKTVDPAVVVMDENGAAVISLLGGHIAGANRLARRLAAISGGRPVITTATDGRGLTAFDDLAARLGRRVKKKELIKIFNAALLENRPIDLCLPPEIFAEYYGGRKNLRLCRDPGEISAPLAVVFDLPAAFNKPSETIILELER